MIQTHLQKSAGLKEDRLQDLEESTASQRSALITVENTSASPEINLERNALMLRF